LNPHEFHLICKTKRLKDYIVEVEESVSMYYLHAMSGVVLALFLFFLTCKAFDVTGPLNEQPFWSALLSLYLLTGILAWWWWFRIRPKRDELVIEAGAIRWHLHLGHWLLWSDKGEAKFDDLKHVSIRDDWHLSRKQAARIQKTKKDRSPTMEFLVDLFLSTWQSDIDQGGRQPKGNRRADVSI
jgi:hypothetical protein